MPLSGWSIRDKGTTDRAIWCARMKSVPPDYRAPAWFARRGPQAGRPCGACPFEIAVIDAAAAVDEPIPPTDCDTSGSGCKLTFGSRGRPAATIGPDTRFMVRAIYGASLGVRSRESRAASRMKPPLVA
jgi:hypothetical protein